jgi:O-acetyl-ADP-ribose deacetylase (regulator of RNase III)
MALQEMEEPTGMAKITRGYHLPASFVLHTVGPIYQKMASLPPKEDRAALASSYQACLDLAAQIPSIRSLAFCCISTGVFRFPPKPAAEIALDTVNRWLGAHPNRFDRIVFTVFKDRDREIYQELLEV